MVKTGPRRVRQKDYFAELIQRCHIIFINSFQLSKVSFFGVLDAPLFIEIWQRCETLAHG